MCSKSKAAEQRYFICARCGRRLAQNIDLSNFDPNEAQACLPLITHTVRPSPDASAVRGEGEEVGVF